MESIHLLETSVLLTVGHVESTLTTNLSVFTMTSLRHSRRCDLIHFFKLGNVNFLSKYLCCISRSNETSYLIQSNLVVCICATASKIGQPLYAILRILMRSLEKWKFTFKDDSPWSWVAGRPHFVVDAGGVVTLWYVEAEQRAQRLVTAAIARQTCSSHHHFVDFGFDVRIHDVQG